VKEQELWVELNRLYELDSIDVCWNFPCHDLSTKWRFYDSCNVHHLSTKGIVDIFMLAKLEYPLRAGVLAVMVSLKIKVEEFSEVVTELL
jgi:hypothetical protein